MSVFSLGGDRNMVKSLFIILLIYDYHFSNCTEPAGSSAGSNKEDDSVSSLSA